MAVGCLIGIGVLPLIFVPPKVKISADYYINYDLKLLLEEKIPKLYGEDIFKVFFHHDAATSHMVRQTQMYADTLKYKLGITTINKA